MYLWFEKTVPLNFFYKFCGFLGCSMYTYVLSLYLSIYFYLFTSNYFYIYLYLYRLVYSLFIYNFHFLRYTLISVSTNDFHHHYCLYMLPSI